MGLRGPLPKDPRRRAGRAAAKADNPNVELVFEAGEAPELPKTTIDEDGHLVALHWSPLTVKWWESWRDSPQSKIFSKSDWQSLLTTAFIAQKFYTTMDVKYASELRMRETAFGATPLDRLKLRMAWLETEDKEAKRPAPAPKPTHQDYTGLRAVGDK